MTIAVDEERPAQEARPGLQSLVHQTSHSSVRGEAMTSPPVQRQHLAAGARPLGEVEPLLGAADDDGLGERLGDEGALGDDRGLHDVGDGRPAGAWVDEVMAVDRRRVGQRWTDVPEVATPRRPG